MKKYLTLALFLSFAACTTSLFAAEVPECPICMNPYTANTPIIQLDCENENAKHTMCLSCASKIRPHEHGYNADTQCPLCRHRFTVFEPRINRNDFSWIHNFPRRLTNEEQTQLQRVVAHARISNKPLPEPEFTVIENCVSCKENADPTSVFIPLACNHRVCLTHAVPLVKQRQPHCPNCNAAIEEVEDIIEYDAYGTIRLIFQNRPPTSHELTIIYTLRNSGIKIDQRYIPADHRVGDPVTKDFIVGLVGGTLIGSECTLSPEKDTYRTARRIAYVPAFALSHYYLSRAEKKRIPSLKNKVMWGAGLGVGIVLHCLLAKKYTQISQNTAVTHAA